MVGQNDYRPGVNQSNQAPTMDVKTLLNRCHHFKSFVYGESASATTAFT